MSNGDHHASRNHFHDKKVTTKLQEIFMIKYIQVDLIMILTIKHFQVDLMEGLRLDVGSQRRRSGKIKVFYFK